VGVCENLNVKENIPTIKLYTEIIIITCPGTWAMGYLLGGTNFSLGGIHAALYVKALISGIRESIIIIKKKH